MTMVCTTLGAACPLYYALLAFRAGPMVNFGWFWILAGAGFWLAAFLRRFPERLAAVRVSRLILVSLAVVFLLIGILSVFVISGMNPPVPGSLDYVIVLGAHVRGKRPSLALSQRIEKAKEASEEYPEAVLILSGGQGSGEEISEAQCMWNELTGSGVDEKRLILEDKSTTTWENLVFSDRLTGCKEKRCGIVSNDFHIFRAVRTARKAGYQDVYGLAGKSEILMKPHYIAREAAALVKSVIFSRPSALS